jgi:hypothetical protein
LHTSFLTISADFARDFISCLGLKELWKLKRYRTYDLKADSPDWEAEAPWMKDFKDFE